MSRPWTEEDAQEARRRAFTDCDNCEHVRCRHVGCKEHEECCDEGDCPCTEFVEPAPHKGPDSDG